MDRLAGAILIQMLKDWERGKDRDEIREFLSSAWFQQLADAVGMDPKDICSCMVSGSYNSAKLRAAYR